MSVWVSFCVGTNRDLSFVPALLLWDNILVQNQGFQFWTPCSYSYQRAYFNTSCFQHSEFSSMFPAIISNGRTSKIPTEQSSKLISVLQTPFTFDTSTAINIKGAREGINSIVNFYSIKYKLPLTNCCEVLPFQSSQKYCLLFLFNSWTRARAMNDLSLCWGKMKEFLVYHLPR